LSDFPNFVSLLNRQLKPLGMELTRGTMEDTGQKWYGLVNRSDDAAAKIATAYSPAELELFNKAVSLSLHSCSVQTGERDMRRKGGRKEEAREGRGIKEEEGGRERERR